MNNSTVCMDMLKTVYLSIYVCKIINLKKLYYFKQKGFLYLVNSANVKFTQAGNILLCFQRSICWLALLALALTTSANTYHIAFATIVSLSLPYAIAIIIIIRNSNTGQQ